MYLVRCSAQNVLWLLSATNVIACYCYVKAWTLFLNDTSLLRIQQITFVACVTKSHWLSINAQPPPSPVHALTLLPTSKLSSLAISYPPYHYITLYLRELACEAITAWLTRQCCFGSCGLKAVLRCCVFFFFLFACFLFFSACVLCCQSLFLRIIKSSSFHQACWFGYLQNCVQVLHERDTIMMTEELFIP